MWSIGKSILIYHLQITYKCKNPKLPEHIIHLEYSSEQLKQIVDYLCKIKNTRKFTEVRLFYNITM